MHDLAMDNLATRRKVNADLQVCAAARPHDLALQPPGDAWLVEDLHAVGGAIDVQMKALAASFAFDIQEKAVSYARCP
jgi:hypothetical protein